MFKQTAELFASEVADAYGFCFTGFAELFHGFPRVNVVDVLRGSLAILLGEELVTALPGYWPVL